MQNKKWLIGPEHEVYLSLPCPKNRKLESHDVCRIQEFRSLQPRNLTDPVLVEHMAFALTKQCNCPVLVEHMALALTKICELESIQGNMSALNNRAWLTFFGHWGVVRNEAAAFAMWSKAMQEGNVNAAVSVAVCLAIGAAGQTRDESKAYQMLLKLSRDKCPSAMYSLAMCLHAGCGVEVNFQAEFAIYQRLAEMGVSDVYFDLAILYDTGEGVDRDEKKSMEWLSKAAEKNDTRALMLLASDLATKDDDETALNTAEDYLRRAIELGDVFARINYANLIARRVRMSSPPSNDFQKQLCSSKKAKEALEWLLEIDDYESSENYEQLAYTFIAYGRGIDAMRALVKGCSDPYNDLNLLCLLGCYLADGIPARPRLPPGGLQQAWQDTRPISERDPTDAEFDAFVEEHNRQISLAGSILPQYPKKAREYLVSFLRIAKSENKQMEGIVKESNIVKAEAKLRELNDDELVESGN